MSTIVTRAGKGSPLTNTEVDSNFTNLNTDKVEKSGDTLTGDLAFGDNVKAKFGASDDLEIYHTGTNSIINEVGVGNLVLSTNGTQVRIAHSTNAEAMAEFNKNGSVLLKHDGADKLETTSSGVDVTGTVVADGATIDGDATLQNSSGSVLLKLDGSTYPEIRLLEGDTTDANSRIVNNGSQLTFQTLADGGATTNRFQINHTSGDVKFYEDTGTTAKLTWDASAEELQFKDNVKAEFGDGGDLQIYHSGTNSQINNSTGNLVLQSLENDKDVVINSDDGSGSTANYFRADGSTGEAILYHYGSQKLATTSTGIDVTGSIVSEIAINAQTGTTYTLVLGDQCQLVTLDNASAVTVTIPPNSSVAYPTGTKIDLLAKGAGQVTVAAGSGVTVNSAQSLKLRAQWSAASAIKLATDTWVLVGDLQAI